MANSIRVEMNLTCNERRASREASVSNRVHQVFAQPVRVAVQFMIHGDETSEERARVEYCAAVA